ncbi:syntaxin 6, N-terminal-domain-containing protein [Rhodofomes roseus]|uniref:Syntaxin 6, N-terminal-domain-containing protein n=1 Tax=Rhodofomes roseus TaxID=34475 RepID=A0ABQ8KF21_9APHY|nr:syntaxin 6, N-terminal-domain-containing protein [Rhodofomes roseus]KAH9836334.1 syntaxin 6, N-terminal-domain-containing protein [Rhodofomes roseus]
MSTDPYHAVQQEIQTSMQAASTLRASYLRIRSTAREDSEELVWARNELKATLAALEADLEDLEESVRVVEQTGARMFGLDESELMERQRYVAHIRREIETMRAEVESDASGKRSRPHSQIGLPAPSSRVSSRATSPAPGDDQAEWARQEQEMIMHQQDQTLDSIGGTLSTLAEQAGLMGREILEHNEMLDDLEQGVDRSGSKLDSAMTRMKRFIRQTEETKSGWCIIILIIVLMILLLLVILL